MWSLLLRLWDRALDLDRMSSNKAELPVRRVFGNCHMKILSQSCGLTTSRKSKGLSRIRGLAGGICNAMQSWR